MFDFITPFDNYLVHFYFYLDKPPVGGVLFDFYTLKNLFCLGW